MKRKGADYSFSGWDPLTPEPEPVTPQSVDADTYGETSRERRGLRASRQVAKPIDIFTIYPDHAQPRRALPSALRDQWDGDPQHLPPVFAAWIEAVAADTGLRYDVAALIAGTGERPASGDAQPPREPAALEANLVRLIDLAASIYRDGLLNPITVGAYNDIYVIETGERRWLAYHLLHALLGEDRWAKIPASEVMPNVWRQASENSARDNLNAVARARQYAILMMDLLAGEAAFQPYDAAESDRAFYAQVLGLRVPTGQTERLLSALGVSSRSALSRYRDVLGLSDQDWLWADDQNVSERELFRVQNNPRVEEKSAKARPVPATFVERVSQSFIEQTQKIDKIEAQIARSPGTDFTALEPLIDQQIERLRTLKKRLRR